MTRARPFVVAALLILSAGAAGAADFGFKVGINWATIPDYTGPVGGLDSATTPSLTGGPFIVFHLAGVLALQPEMLYVEKGTVLRAANPDLDLETTLELEYLEFPILARIEAKQPGRTSLYALAGPSFGYGFRATERIESLGQESERELDTIKPFEVSLVLGGGVRVGWLLAEGRYTQGLTTIDGEPGTPFKNRCLAVLLGFQF
ncbi:MAG TPA: porin family protein [Vicinamibacteria bacterium]